MSDEPIDLRQAITDYAQALRDDYARRLNEPTQWLLYPREYDAFQEASDAGTLTPEQARFFANCVRAESWSGDE